MFCVCVCVCVVLSMTLGLFLGPYNVDTAVAWTSIAFLLTGMLSLLLALLYAISDCQYSSAVEDERSSRPVDRLEVQSANEEGYARATPVSTSYPTSGYTNANAPPLPVAKMQPMSIH